MEELDDALLKKKIDEIMKKVEQVKDNLEKAGLSVCKKENSGKDNSE